MPKKEGIENIKKMLLDRMSIGLTFSKLKLFELDRG
jgi:hypothetical protein